MVEVTDEQLVADYFKGDEKSLEVLVQRYLKPIYSFVYRHTGSRQETEDITQDVFVRAWKNLKKFDKGKSFKTWIFSIAKNAAIDFLRKKKAVPLSQFEDLEGGNIVTESLIDPAPLASELLEQKDISKTLETALQKLSLPYRTVLILRYNDHLNFREIAEVLGEPLNTVKSRHRRAIFMLRGFLIK